MDGKGRRAMLTESYAHIINDSVDRICRTQAGGIAAAAGFVRDVIAADGLVYVFGCGHSHILAEETFYRAGGLACVSPVFYEPLMLHESAWHSSVLEKQSGLARDIYAGLGIGGRDMLICVSTSGKNAVPVELAALVRASGVPVAAVCSSAYFEDEARNGVSQHLYQCCDVWIDNMAPHGDACLQPEGLPVMMTPLSTVTSSFIVNAVLAEGTELALKAGLEPPVYKSGNVPGGAEYNEALIARYKSRIKCL